MGRKALLALLAGTICPPAGAAVVEVSVFSNGYSPNAITIQVGDTVRWMNVLGFHDVRADDGSFSSGPPASAPWTYERTFTQPGEYPYYCTVHGVPGQPLGIGMNGRVVVEGTAPPPAFAINQGIAGAWFDPPTSGQGFLIDIEPASRFMFVAWFTYEVAAPAKVGAPEHRWLTAQGSYEGNTAMLDLFVTAGGAFDDPRDPTTTAVGTLGFAFEDCGSGTATYAIPAQQLAGTVPIQRVVPGAGLLCEMLAGEAAAGDPD